MNWKWKAHLLAILSRAYGGRLAYHLLQQLLGTNRLEIGKTIAIAQEVLALIRQSGRDPCQGRYMEIGTGWHPFLPFILHLIGAERTITLDINPWMTHAHALETCQLLGRNLEMIADALDVSAVEMRARYEQASLRTASLNELLSGFHVEYRCPGRADCTGLDDRSVDFVISADVLAHIPPPTLAAIHRETLRVLKPNGLAVHRIDPRDQYSLFDRSITSANFLRFSESQWHWYGGAGLAYHNRLRCIQHRALMTEAGMVVVQERKRIDQASVQAISAGDLPVHAAFAAYPAEELAADQLWIACSPHSSEKPASRLTPNQV